MAEIQKNVYVSHKIDAAHNFAFEEYLMNQCGVDEINLFLWSSAPTVVIGKHQNPYLECNLKSMKDDSVKLVRRLSGGGTVYHDEGNLNFSFIADNMNYDINRHLNIILHALSQLGIQAIRNDRNDLLVEADKFSGSAFVNQKNVCCHHGTLLISSNLHNLRKYLKPLSLGIKSKGVSSVRSSVCNLVDVAPNLKVEMVINQLIQSFDSYCLGQLSIKEMNETLSISHHMKYNSWKWNYGYTPKFEWHMCETYPWGQCEIYLKVCNGIVIHLEIESDQHMKSYFDPVKNAVINKELRHEVLTNLLNDNATNEIFWDSIELIKRNLSGV